MQNIPSLTYMDGETVSQLSARIDRQLSDLFHKIGEQDGPATDEQALQVEDLQRVATALSIVVDHLNGEHFAFQDARDANKPDHSDREQFREGAI